MSVPYLMATAALALMILYFIFGSPSDPTKPA